MTFVADWALAHDGEIAANLSATVNLTSPPDQARFPDERARDFHGVITGHVFGRLSAFDICRAQSQSAAFQTVAPLSLSI